MIIHKKIIFTFTEYMTKEIFDFINYFYFKLNIPILVYKNTIIYPHELNVSQKIKYHQNKISFDCLTR